MKWHQWEAVNRDSVREGGRMAFGRYVNTHYDFTKANVVVSLGSDFLGEGPGPSPLRPRLHVAAARCARRRTATQSINRLYAHRRQHVQHRLGRRSPHRRSSPRRWKNTRAPSSAGQATPSPVAERADQGPAGQPRQRASSSPATNSLPSCTPSRTRINSQLGNIGTTVLVTDPIEVAPTNQLASLQELVRDMNSRRCEGADHPRRQPRLRRAGRSAVREGAGQGPVPRASLALLRRDLAALPLAHPRDALPGDLGRRPRTRRHDLHHPAAHRPALQRPLRARDPRRADRRSRSDAVPDRPRLLADPGRHRQPPGANGSTTA